MRGREAEAPGAACAPDLPSGSAKKVLGTASSASLSSFSSKFPAQRSESLSGVNPCRALHMRIHMASSSLLPSRALGYLKASEFSH